MESGASTHYRYRSMRNILVGVLLSASLMSASCASEPARPNPRAEISGRVVDAATGQPLEGAAIWATWYAEALPSPEAIAFGLAVGGHGGSNRRVVQVKEALTDRDGRFVIPEWTVIEQLHAGIMTRGSPGIGFFKAGYEPAGLNRSGWEGGRSEGEPGINGQPKEMALYRYGKKPKQDPGFTDSSFKIPSPEEAILQTIAALRDGLESNVSEADDGDAPRDSRARLSVKKALQRTTEMVTQELQRLQNEYSKKKGQQGKDKQ